MSESHPSDVLLANLDWARRLARALVLDEARADDLVQDAWLRARSGAPEGAEDGRRWLGRVLRNLARDRGRERARRARREERAARPEVAPSDDELRERLARQQALVGWVQELDDPYRRTLLLRWFEGRDAQRIAAEEGVPVATVRTRLRRGAALLRARAEREAPGDGRAWLAGLAGLVPRTTTVTTATTATTTPTAAATLIAATIAMNSKLLAALALALVLAAGWVLSPWSATVERSAPNLPARSTGAEEVAATSAGSPAAVAQERAAAPSAATDEPASAKGAPAASPEDLLVRVVDSDGAPAIGERVVVVRGRIGDEERWLEATSEAPDGIARFADYVPQFERLNADGAAALKFVGLDYVGLEPPRAPLPTKGLPESVPVLQVAPYGELLVRLVDGGGDPYPITDHLNVTPFGEAPSPGWSPKRGDRTNVYLRQGSEALFPRVAPGTALLIEVHSWGVLADVQETIPALRAGERRTVELVLGAKNAHVVGRLVHGDGLPVKARGFDVDFGGHGSVRVFAVGADGSFELPLGRLILEEGRFTARISVAPGNLSTNEGPEPEALSGTFEATLPAKGEAYDVGEVILRPAPTIAAGRVVNPRGEPVEGVTIGVLEKLNQREDPEDFTWGFTDVNYVVTDADGRFDVKGLVDPGEYALRVFFGDWIDRGALRFEAGTRGLEVVVDRRRTVVGQLLLPAGVDPTIVEVHAREEEATRERATYASWSTPVDSEGGFRIGGLRPEPVTIAVHLVGTRAPIAELRGIAPWLDDDEPNDALAAWDLTGALAPLRFDVHLATGARMETGFVALGSHVLEHRSGRIEAVAPSSWGDELLVFAPGHVPQRVPIAADLDRVDLQQGPRVVVALDAPLPELPADVDVDLILVPREASWKGPAPFDSGWFLGSERVPCRAGETSWELHGAGAGKYEPEWVVTRRPNGPLGSSRSFRVETKGRSYAIELDPAKGGTTRHVAEVDREAFARELEELMGDAR